MRVMKCQRCGYLLQGLEGRPRCPECGGLIPEAIPIPRWNQARAVATIVWSGLLLTFLLLNFACLFIDPGIDDPGLPARAAEDFTILWMVIGAAAIVVLPVLIILKRVPALMWAVAGGSLGLAALSVVANYVYVLIHYASV